jgi:uncharacterized membrane protein YfcA
MGQSQALAHLTDTKAAKHRTSAGVSFARRAFSMMRTHLAFPPPMSATFIFICITVASLITSFISGILGMAGGMILMGVLLALLSLPAAMMMHGITQLASNGGRAWLWRREVNWRIFRGYAMGAMVALAAFLAVQLIVSKPVAYILLGLTPFIGFALPKRLALNIDSKGQPFICGIVCMGMQLLAGIAGPLLDVFFVRSKMDRRGVVATKAMSQTLSHLTKIIYFGTLASLGAAGARATAGADAFAGLTWPLIVTCVLLAFTGTTLSRRVLEKMSDANFRNWTQWTVWTMGVIYLGNGLWLMWARG